MNWNKWIRQVHRWLSIIFTVGFLINLVAWTTAKPPTALGLLVLIPLVLLLATGLYLFVLPYLAKWRGRRSGAQASAA